MKNFKKALLIPALLLLTIVGFSQNTTTKVEIEWGDAIKASKRSSLMDIFAYDETGFYARRFEKNKVYLEHYGKACNQTQSVEMDLSEGNKEKAFEGFLHLDGTVYLYSSFSNRKEKKNYLFYQTLNKKTLLPNDDIKKIAEIDFSDQKRRNDGYFGYRLSGDSTKVLVYYMMPYEKEANEALGFHVFNSKMEEQWQKEIEIPYVDELYSIDKFRVDSEGSAYILGRKYREKVKDRVKGKPNYSYEIISFNSEGLVDTYPISLDEKFINELTFRVDDNKDLICAGFYSDEGTSSMKGTYFMKVDGKSKLVKGVSTKEFGLDFITQNFTDKEAKKAKKKSDKGKDVELYSYDLDNLILRDDGGAILVGEQYFMRVSTSTFTDANGNTSTRTTYHYYYNDIIVINISSSGEVEWAQKIPKRQHSTNDGGYRSSYAMSIVDDKIYFVFNDHQRNLFVKDGEKLSNYTFGKDGVVVLVTMDKYGEFEKESLFRKNDVDVITVPKLCEQVSEKEMIIYGSWKKEIKFGKATFE